MSMTPPLFDSWQPPDWRARRLTELAVCGSAPDEAEDPHVGAAYQGWRGKSVRPAAVGTVRRLYEGGGLAALEIEARLLTDEPLGVIAAKTGVSVETVGWFEALAFNVRPDGRRAGGDWLRIHVIGDDWDYIDPPPRIVWRYAAMAGGPVLVDMLADEQRGRMEPRTVSSLTLWERARLMVRTTFTPLADRKASAAVHQDMKRWFKARSKSSNGRAKPHAMLAEQMDFLTALDTQRQGDTKPRPCRRPVAVRGPAGPGKAGKPEKAVRVKSEPVNRTRHDARAASGERGAIPGHPAIFLWDSV